jgi:hypothetical protein
MRRLVRTAFVFAATLAGGFLLAGFCALLAHDDADERGFNEKLAEAKSKGPWQEYLTMRWEAFALFAGCITLAQPTGGSPLDMAWSGFRCDCGRCGPVHLVRLSQAPNA